MLCSHVAPINLSAQCSRRQGNRNSLVKVPNCSSNNSSNTRQLISNNQSGKSSQHRTNSTPNCAAMHGRVRSEHTSFVPAMNIRDS